MSASRLDVSGHNTPIVALEPEQTERKKMSQIEVKVPDIGEFQGS